MSDKTEQPTPKRLREAREKGDICKSPDIASALTVLAVAVYVTAAASGILEILLAMTGSIMDVAARPYEEALPQALGAVG